MRVDDLKAISGCRSEAGAGCSTIFGIWTYAQIAALDAAEIAWLDDELGFSGRIGRDDWTGQARQTGQRTISRLIEPGQSAAGAAGIGLR